MHILHRPTRTRGDRRARGHRRLPQPAHQRRGTHSLSGAGDRRARAKRTAGAAPKAETRRRTDELTAREREVLSLLAQGLTDRGISEKLWLTPKTVETHIRHILAKLELPTGTHHNRRVLAVLTYLQEDPIGFAIVHNSH